MRLTFLKSILPLTVVLSIAVVSPVAAQTQDQAVDDASRPQCLTARSWLNPALDPDARAEALIGCMPQAQKVALIQGENFGLTAGKLLDLSEYGLPVLLEADAPRGITNAARTAPGVVMPVNIATAASWDIALAEERGRALAEEARGQGIGILLSPSGNLVRDPRGGRTSEYLGEDPVLAGRMMAAITRGIQARHVLATVKHFGINGWESQRKTVNMQIGDAAARESDLLAFEIALHEGRPAAVMCAYPWLNGVPSCASRYLLDDVLRRDWAYPGFVMSDWDAFQDGPTSANAGLDLQSGILPTTNPNPAFARFAGGGFNDGRSIVPPGPFGPGSTTRYYGNIQSDIDAGRVTQARLDQMVHRILRSIFAVGIVEAPPHHDGYDVSAHRAIAQRQTEEGAVLIKNHDGALPLAPTSGSIALIGGVADGVFSRPTSRFPSEPAALDGPSVRTAMTERLGGQIRYDPGTDVDAAVRLAAESDMVVVFADMPATEGADLESLSLANNGDALIERVAAANPNTIVVLAVSNPPIMPWADQVRGILVSWQLGDRSGEALARLLTGEANPSGKLPISFPSSLAELPRRTIPGFNRGGLGGLYSEVTDIPLSEGANVGYRWYASQNRRPAYAFGEGLSYTRFAYGPLSVVDTVQGQSASFTLTNTGDMAGSEVVQIYAEGPGAVRRLIGFSKIHLVAGEERTVTLPINRRLLAHWDETAQQWLVGRGTYVLSTGSSAEVIQQISVPLSASVETETPPSL